MCPCPKNFVALVGTRSLMRPHFQRKGAKAQSVGRARSPLRAGVGSVLTRRLGRNPTVRALTGAATESVGTHGRMRRIFNAKTQKRRVKVGRAVHCAPEPLALAQPIGLNLVLRALTPAATGSWSCKTRLFRFGFSFPHPCGLRLRWFWYISREGRIT